MADNIHHYTFTMPLAPWKVECPICGKVVNRDELEEHIRREHEVWVARYVLGKRENPPAK